MRLEFEELSVEERAQIVGITVANVRIRHSRARALLRRVLRAQITLRDSNHEYEAARHVFTRDCI